MPDSPAHYALLVLLAWLLLNGVLIAFYWRELARLWREPVFRYPILIVESDDWGAGPLVQAEALRQIAAILSKHRDGTGHSPVFSLALVLAVPDGPAIRCSGEYRRLTLAAPLFQDVMAALREGEAQGVFSLQLHGMEHYWPDALLASGDAAVRHWLEGAVPAVSETLPAPLQSRWVDAARLPSTPHDAMAIHDAVAEEVRAYAGFFGAMPKGVVPPTFVWTKQVEAAWAEHGIEYVVTPGWRYTRRNVQGMPDGAEGPLVNGERNGGLTYVVRTDYFEPGRGRDAAYALLALHRAVAQRRPCVLENHRDNFIRAPEPCQRSLAELDKLFAAALARYGDLRFLSTRELAQSLRTGDAQWIESGLARRMDALWHRLQHCGRFWKLMTRTGLVGLLSIFMELRARMGAVHRARAPAERNNS